jgi:hypothetical protein
MAKTARTCADRDTGEARHREPPPKRVRVVRWTAAEDTLLIRCAVQ